MNKLLIVVLMLATTGCVSTSNTPKTFESRQCSMYASQAVTTAYNSYTATGYNDIAIALVGRNLAGKKAYRECMGL
jgi:hypothetical protein